MAAAHGTPVPTATVRPSSSKRAAQQIINSIALQASTIARGSVDQETRKSGERSYRP
jgi:hypothetical protein